jgi:hypothetical protein
MLLECGIDCRIRRNKAAFAQNEAGHEEWLLNAGNHCLDSEGITIYRAANFMVC